MRKFEKKVGTHFVLKNDDCMYYLNRHQKVALRDGIDTIAKGRLDDGKKLNDYFVVNIDEPYAQEVFEVIKKGETNKL